MRFRRVLVSMKTYLGDAVMALPMIEAAERESAETVFLAGGAVGDILRAPDRPREVLKWPRVRRLGDVLDQARRLRRRGFDAAFLVNHSFRSALTVRLAGIPVRSGHALEGRGILLSPAVAYDQSRYEPEANFDLLRAVGLTPESAQPTLTPHPDDVARGRLLVPPGAVGLQPGARFGEKQIPVAVTTEIARRLAAGGRPVVLLGGPEEAPFAESLVREVPTATNLVGKTDLPGTFGLLANLAAMVGSDTGLMHLAAAIGTPTLTVFGPTPADKWGHDYAPHRVVRAPEGRMDRVTADALGPEIECLLSA